ncbi:MAG: hypothetical protein DRP78_06280, partial [Candidatus Omnitrophota bacterium]
MCFLQNNKKINWKKEVFAGIVFILISIYATFPLIFHLTESFYGTKTDPLAWIWTFWWYKYAYLHSLPANFVPILAYPFGLHKVMLYPLWDWLNQFLSISLGEITAYNFQVMLSFFLSGISMYCLSYYFTKSRISALFSGIIFTLCPYHFARAWDHLCLSNMHWMVFYILALFMFAKETTLKRALICGLCFSLIGQFSSYYYVYFMIIFTALFIVFAVSIGLKRRKFNLRNIFHIALLASAGCIAACIIVLPQSWTYLKMVILSPEQACTAGIIRPFNHLFADSAMPLNYFLPAVYHPVLGRITSFFIDTPLYGENSGAEQTLYLGVIPLILSFIGYKKWKQSRKNGLSSEQESFVIKFWAIGFFVFMIFSFSPYWGARSGLHILFPSYFLFQIAPMFRNYARFGVLVMISVCVLSGFGLKYLLKNIKDSRQKILLACIILIMTMFEFLNMPPYRITNADIPEVYLWLKTQPVNIIAEYPLEADERQLLFWQRIHQKALINGAVSGTEADLVKQKIIDIEAKYTAGILKFLGAEYVIVHKQKYSNYEGGVIVGRVPELTENENFELVKSFEQNDVFRIISEPVNPDIVSLSNQSHLMAKIGEDKHRKLTHIPELCFAFKPGERFNYSVNYFGLIPLGQLKLSISNFENMQLWHDYFAVTNQKYYDNEFLVFLKAVVLPSRLLRCFVDIKAQAESCFDCQLCFPYYYQETSQIGQDKLKQKKVFYGQQSGIMYAKDKMVKINELSTLDPVSALFFLSSVKFVKGKKFNIYVNPGKSNYVLKIEVKNKQEKIIHGNKMMVWSVCADIFKKRNQDEKIARLI